MSLICEERLLNPSPPSLFKIAAAEFINSRQVRWKNGGTFEQVCEFLIEGTNINNIYFDCNKKSVRRILYTLNNLSEILAWERKERIPYRPYTGWLGRSGRVGNHIIVKLKEEVETTTENCFYKACICDIQLENKIKYCWYHDSVL